MKYFIVAGCMLISILQACQNKDNLSKSEAIIKEIKAQYAPDTRVAFFSIAAEQRESNVVVKGRTISAAAHEDLIKKHQAANIEILDSVEVLPSPALGGKFSGLVNVSVCNIRSQPKHSAELATQALLGTPLKVWARENGFFLVQTPDDYFGWVDGGGIVTMDSDSFDEYLRSGRAVCIQDYVFAYSSPAEDEQVVSDLLAGNILQVVGQEGGFAKVAFPDKRTAFVKSTHLMPLPAWLASRQPSAENILATAKEMMGRPYLWGGTSGKGMDCSGFTKTVFYLNGLQLPRDASQQVLVGEPLEADSTLEGLMPGDLLFFGRKKSENAKERITHVAIYMGDGKIIHASNMVETGSLRKEDPDFQPERLKSFVRAKRVMGVSPETGVIPLDRLPSYSSQPLAN